MGFGAAALFGSENNDPILPGGFGSNHAGGILGGISTGAPVVARCAVKPTPSIALPQQTIDAAGRPVEVRVGGRHDPCIAFRLAPVAEAMLGLVLADALLVQEAYGSSACGSQSAAGRSRRISSRISSSVYCPGEDGRPAAQ